MNTKTVKSKTASINHFAKTNGKRADGNVAKPKKSMYEKWIEKYGVSDSKADRSMLKTMKKIYEANSRSDA